MKTKFLTLVVALLISTNLLAKSNKTSIQYQGRVVELVDGKIQAVPFALVSIVGTTTTVYTNENGEFILPKTVDQNQTLRLSFVGYAVKEFPVSSLKAKDSKDFELDKNQNVLVLNN